MSQGKLLRASFGTSKFCTFFLQSIKCSNKDCLYLHEIRSDLEVYTKEDMANNKIVFQEQQKIALKLSQVLDFEREGFIKQIENKMHKNYGKEAVKCQKKFALPETIYDKEFHFFNSTLQDYKENLQFQRLNSEEEKKERKVEARSLENEKKPDKKNKTIESSEEMTFILEEINNARKNDKADATSIQLCQSPVQKLVEQKAPISVGNRKEAEEAGSTISKTPPFGEIYKGTSM